MHSDNTKTLTLQRFQHRVDVAMDGHIQPFVAAHRDAAASAKRLVLLHHRMQTEHAGSIAGTHNGRYVVRFMHVIRNHSKIRLPFIKAGLYFLKTLSGHKCALAGPACMNCRSAT